MWQWIIANKAAVVMWLGWSVSEILDLIPSAKLQYGSVIGVVLGILGYKKGETPILPQPKP